MFFKIGFFLSFIYSGINEDGFEWGIRWLNDGEWIELFNLNNFVSVRVSVVINVYFVFNYGIYLDNGMKIIKIVNR